MQGFAESVATALRLLLEFDAELQEIILLSLKVSGSATVLAALLGMPLGAWLAISNFRFRGVVVAVLTALMGLPPVVVGLIAYLLLTSGGLFGPLQLLYTPAAMIFAQTLLITPIVAALTRQNIETLHVQLSDQLSLFGISRWQRLLTVLWEGRYELITTFLAGFGRAVAEVGAVIIVGGNINHVTRVMTTTIALETSRGNLSLALGLGIVLVCIAVTANSLVLLIGHWSKRRSHGLS
ncbi:MAG: ABC transporter permease [Gammaproteobacteria bacterium]|nr:ABC transporter permease [Gammaproteobacteria bacterium]